LCHEPLQSGRFRAGLVPDSLCRSFARQLNPDRTPSRPGGCAAFRHCLWSLPEGIGDERSGNDRRSGQGPRTGRTPREGGTAGPVEAGAARKSETTEIAGAWPGRGRAFRSCGWLLGA